MPHVHTYEVCPYSEPIGWWWYSVSIVLSLIPETGILINALYRLYKHKRRRRQITFILYIVLLIIGFLLIVADLLRFIVDAFTLFFTERHSWMSCIELTLVPKVLVGLFYLVYLEQILLRYIGGYILNDYSDHLDLTNSDDVPFLCIELSSVLSLLFKFRRELLCCAQTVCVVYGLSAGHFQAVCHHSDHIDGADRHCPDCDVCVQCIL